MLKNIRFLIVTIIILSFSLQVKSQELGTVYSNYFELPRESIFLHLNKTTYITGEDIYFKAYIYNRQTGKPFSETTNLIVGIYDSLGNQVIKKQFISGNGFGNGHFELDSSFPSESIYKLDEKFL
jgi:hypothetical protein